jgi:hypothetical protein
MALVMILIVRIGAWLCFYIELFDSFILCVPAMFVFHVFTSVIYYYKLLMKNNSVFNAKKETATMAVPNPINIYPWGAAQSPFLSLSISRP